MSVVVERCKEFGVCGVVGLVVLLLLSSLCVEVRADGLQASERWVLQAFELQEEGRSEWHRAELPGTVQGGLVGLGLLPDPFVGANEDSVQWVSDRNWLYRATLELEEGALARHDRFWLEMGSVDTFAEVYLNGALVGRCDNLFRHYRWEVKGYLRSGVNRLVIRLLSPLGVAHAQYLSNGFMYPADNDRGAVKYSPFVRTAPYQYGWDWGPRLVAMGVKEPVVLRGVGVASLGELQLRNEIEWSEEGVARSATVSIASEVEGDPEGSTLRVELLDPEGQRLSSGEGAQLTMGVENPRLWMPRGWGEQPLYQVVRILVKGGAEETVLERDTTLFGIREIQLDRSEDARGERFQFVVNGRPLYVKGANYLPHDRWMGGGSRTLEQVFQEDILPLHFNMLRVWGGGIYESEEFYQLADRYGILVWQDLPFACTAYPSDPTFRASVEMELEDQVKRLRKHPSLALLCGNNEVLEGLKHWGWQRSYGYSDEEYREMLTGYDALFRQWIPQKLKVLVPDVAYIHGSPVSSNWGRPESFLKGDSHNWRVWFGGKDFTEFDQNPGRFASEYGFQAFPERKTVESFAPDVQVERLTIESPILKNRQRSFVGNQRITDYLSRAYPVPGDFVDYIYVGQLLQGDGMGYAIRALRRAYPLNMGSLYWQLNDVWPTVSWSGVDYWGNHKALHYRVREAYAPYIVDLVEGAIWVASDEVLKPEIGPLVVELKGQDYFGRQLWTEQFSFRSERYPFSQKVGKLAKEKLEQCGGQLFVELELKAGQKLLARNLFFPTLPKEMQLPKVAPSISLEASQGRLRVTLCSPVLVKSLFVETPWQGAQYSDNFFDLLPNRPYTIEITHSAIDEGVGVEMLRLTSLNDILAR